MASHISAKESGPYSSFMKLTIVDCWFKLADLMELTMILITARRFVLESVFLRGSLE